MIMIAHATILNFKSIIQKTSFLYIQSDEQAISHATREMLSSKGRKPEFIIKKLNSSLSLRPVNNSSTRY